MKNDNIFEYFKTCVVDNYVNFTGRARRMEFWSFQLVVFLISSALNVVTALANTDLNIFSGVFSLAMLLPSLAVTSRRLHDVGKSGLMFLLIFIPVIGWIWLLVLLFTDGETTRNKWGYNPKNTNIDNEIDFIGTE
jgi:uncharacterized membrane protein YhaH (DUF805 family)